MQRPRSRSVSIWGSFSVAAQDIFPDEAAADEITIIQPPFPAAPELHNPFGGNLYSPRQQIKI
jgi:hypothetical protein